MVALVYNPCVSRGTKLIYRTYVSWSIFISNKEPAPLLQQGLPVKRQTMTDAERQLVIRTVVEQANQRIL